MTGPSQDAQIDGYAHAVGREEGGGILYQPRSCCGSCASATTWARRS